MSRSYRRPYLVDGYGTKRKAVMKRKINRSLRQNQDIASGMEFKKHNCTWDIADYRMYCGTDDDGFDAWSRTRQSRK